jgi:hypothetical protein
MARFAANQSAHARQLLERISDVFIASGNIYESYDMSGKLGGDPGSNYLEHCGGFSWALTEGLYGIDFYSAGAYSATISDPLSRMDPAWGAATAKFVLRGTDVTLTVNPSSGSLTIRGVGPKQVRKRRFLRHLYINAIILPRQARDKHRKNSKKVPFSARRLGLYRAGRQSSCVSALVAD